MADRASPFPIPVKANKRKPTLAASTAANDAITGGNDLRTNHKRAQNRLSQQCAREKRLAQSKQLDLLASVIKSSGADLAERQTSLVNAQLELLKENEALKEGLLRMRKKLLSLSTAAAAAAGEYKTCLVSPVMDFRC